MIGHQSQSFREWQMQHALDHGDHTRILILVKNWRKHDQYETLQVVSKLYSIITVDIVPVFNDFAKAMASVGEAVKKFVDDFSGLFKLNESEVLE